MHRVTPYYGALGAQFIGHRFHLAADVTLKAEKHHMLTSSGYADGSAISNDGKNMVRKEKITWL